MALKELMDRGILKSIISQNVDGLHRKSGIPFDELYELHGNMNLEVCKECNKNYLRSFMVRDTSDPKEHQTTRLCSAGDCRGQLCDTIVNFGDPLNPLVVHSAFDVAAKADLMLSLGSSYSARPANKIPLNVCWNGGKLVVINLQKTSIDNFAEFVIYARIQTVMAMLMEKLSIPIPTFEVRKQIQLTLEGTALRAEEVEVGSERHTFLKDQFCPYEADAEKQFVRLTFQGDQYNENYIEMEVPTRLLTEDKPLVINLSCNPHAISNDKRRIKFGQWESVTAQIIPNKDNLKLRYRQGPYKTKKSLMQKYLKEEL